MKSRQKVQPYIIGIAGGSASGKTSFLARMQKKLGENMVAIVSQDNYYLPKEHQEKDSNGEVNFDLPTSIDSQRFFKDVVALASGKSIEIDEYTFNNSERKALKVVVNPAPIIVVEGLFVFHYPQIREFLDLRVYIDVREDIKLHRRIKRDGTERGYNEDVVRYQWKNHVMPSFKKFLKPYRDDSNIIITNNINYTKGLEVLCDHLKWRLSSLGIELEVSEITQQL
ncbi:MAG: uridine kinase [Flavobacteriales bacterium]|jgi:uridine kinase